MPLHGSVVFPNRFIKYNADPIFSVLMVLSDEAHRALAFVSFDWNTVSN